MNRWLALGVWVVLAGCTGSKGDPGAMGAMGLPGMDGTNGMDGMDGMNGMDGANGANGTNGNDIILSSKAKHGLDISPVAVNLTGRSAADIEQIGRGSYLVNAVGSCADCHSPDADSTHFLSGGSQFPIDGSGDYVVARNLTPDSVSGLQLSESQFIDAMRTGLDARNMGQMLLVMPWPVLRWMATDDIQAIYAYLKAIPPVSNLTGGDVKGPLASATPVPFPSDYDEGDVDRPLPAETDFMMRPVPDPGHVIRGLAIQPLAEPSGFASLSAADQAAFGRGSYLVNAVGSCNDCHSHPDRDMSPGATFLDIHTDAYLSGGKVFEVPPALAPVLHETRSMSADLLGATHGFFNEPTATFATFDAILQYGMHIDDPVPTPLAWPMPWGHLRDMTLDDLSAVYTYLHVLATDSPRTGSNDKATQMTAVYCTMDTDCTGVGGTCNMATNECVGASCTIDADCPACQHCTATACSAPDPTADAACLNDGI